MPSVTINFSAAHSDRIQAAIEDSLDRPATVNDLKDFIVDEVKSLVQSYENKAAIKAAKSSITSIDLS